MALAISARAASQAIRANSLCCASVNSPEDTNLEATLPAFSLWKGFDIAGAKGVWGVGRAVVIR